MAKYRATLVITVVVEADTIEDAEQKVDNAVNMHKLFKQNNMTVIRNGVDVTAAGA